MLFYKRLDYATHSYVWQRHNIKVVNNILVVQSSIRYLLSNGLFVKTISGYFKDKIYPTFKFWTYASRKRSAPQVCSQNKNQKQCRGYTNLSKS